MNEYTRTIVQKTLDEARKFNLETEVVCCMLEYVNDVTKNWNDDLDINIIIKTACEFAKQEWDV